MSKRNRGPGVGLVAWAMLAAVGGMAAARGAEPRDPAPDDADFAVQGEYAGELLLDGRTVKFGAQVVALGGGKFRGAGYRGGLPGDGWDGSRRRESEGATRDGVTTLTTGEGVVAEIREGRLTVRDDGRELGSLERVERASPTLGAKPPQGAVVLFDGRSAEAFVGGRMTVDGLLLQGATSKQTFQSGTLHLEFRTPFMPTATGQGRGNSGVYLQGRYEVQVLDSFGLAGEHNECGGIYSIRAPRVNMCLPPWSWQTYDVEFTAAEFAEGKRTRPARITVRHNGELIHEDVELTHATTAAPLAEGPEPGPLYLQDHGNPVRYRNVWLLEKK
jgi:hypothetical protein